MKTFLNEHFPCPFVWLAFFLLLGCKIPESNDKLRLAVASNMQYVITELTSAFTSESGIECDITVGASGQLTAQILEGAPFDVFVSADMTYPKAIQKAGLAAGAPKVYAYGKIVLWTAADDLVPSFEALTSDRVTHVAIANPRLAPYGVAALQALRHHNVNHSVSDKLVYGENISQTHQFIATGAAQAGITAKSLIFSPAMKNKGRYLNIEEDTYDPIAQGVVVIKDSHPDYSKEILFCNFLTSTTAKKILQRYGYSVDE